MFSINILFVAPILENHMEKILRIQRQKGLQMAALKMNTRIVSLMMMKIQRSCHLPLFIAVKVTFKNMMAMHNTVKRQIKTIFFLKQILWNSDNHEF